MGAPDDKVGHKSAGAAVVNAPASPRKTRANVQTTAPDDDDAAAAESTSSSTMQEKPNAFGDVDMWKQLELEKARYPGASTWAPDEEKLFELLFFRQDLPILPLHWELDLRGVPISEANFADGENLPIVYAHSKDFLGILSQSPGLAAVRSSQQKEKSLNKVHETATMALVRLIELTAAIRTTSESGLHHRLPGMIKDGLDKFLAWAAEDGGYSHLRVVPNIITEIVDTAMQETDITALLQGRMHALARLQREFLRKDRDPSFWEDSLKGEAQTATENEDDDDIRRQADRNELLLQKYLSPRKNNHGHKNRKAKHLRRRRRSSNSMEDELARAAPGDQTPSADGAAPKRRRTFASPSSELDELAKPGGASSGMPSSPPASERREARRLFSSPTTMGTGLSSRGGSPCGEDVSAVEYRRQPPVVYGLFILNTSVFILTVDAALGDTAYVSFHVETDFMEHRQSVWNALTLAIVTCLARDDLRERMEDFEPQAAEEDDSDPDV